MSYYNQILNELEKQVTSRIEQSKWEDCYSNFENISFDFEKSRYSVREFIRFFDGDLIFVANRAILGEIPEKEDFSRSLRDLRSGGISRIGLLERVRHSPKGKERNVKITGLFTRARYERLSRIPVLGKVVKYSVGLLRAPSLFQKLEALERELYLQNIEIDRKLNFASFHFEKEISEIYERLSQKTDSIIAGNSQMETMKPDEDRPT